MGTSSHVLPWFTAFTNLTLEHPLKTAQESLVGNIDGMVNLEKYTLWQIDAFGLGRALC